jgi:hypothetical protein
MRFLQPGASEAANEALTDKLIAGTTPRTRTFVSGTTFSGPARDAGRRRHLANK